jgi:2,3-bisphosphoglycerate-independent phosphoglycerate mutase
MLDYSAGDVSSEEAHQLIAALNAAAARVGLKFYGGVSYRHLLIWRDGPAELALTPPHEISGKPIAGFLPQGPRAEEVVALMNLSRHIFAEHPVNRARIARGLRPATQIWPWGFGKAMALQPYPERYGLRGGVITAVDLVRGLAELCGLEVIRVPAPPAGSTPTTPARRRRRSLACGFDFVYVHVEAPDECGHKGMPRKGARHREFRPPGRRARLGRAGSGWPAVSADRLHRPPHPHRKRGHTSDPVPFAWVDGPLGADAPADAAAAFDEFWRLRLAAARVRRDFRTAAVAVSAAA